MGLEAVEFIMQVEDKFGITIEDQEASKIRTPKAMIELVSGKVSMQKSDICLSQRAFHMLRRHFIENLKIDRNKFRPKSMIQELIPKENILQFWKDIKCNLGFSKWPELNRPKNAIFSILFLSFFISLSIAIAISKSYSISGIIRIISHSLMYASAAFLVSIIVIAILAQIPRFKNWPQQIYNIIQILPAFILSAIMIIIWIATDHTNWQLLGGFVLLLSFSTFALLGFLLTRNFKIIISKRYERIEDLVNYIVAENADSIQFDSSIWNLERIKSAIRELVLSHSPVKNDEYKEDEDFYNYYGWG